MQSLVFHQYCPKFAPLTRNDSRFNEDYWSRTPNINDFTYILGFAQPVNPHSTHTFPKDPKDTSIGNIRYFVYFTILLVVSYFVPGQFAAEVNNTC